jgi:peptidoglycan/xylan/chitin deacetylase (PgdA/CDA1 family)
MILENSKIFLTFDDGPNEYTLKILEILKNFDARATFFVCGKNLEKFPEIAKKIIENGHEIGNHTYSHSINFLFPWNFQKEIEKTDKIIQKITGVKTRFFRPPFGFLTPWLKNELLKNGYKIILWDIDSKDWQGKISDKSRTFARLRYFTQPQQAAGYSKVRDKIFEEIKPNSILLFHDCLPTSLILSKILATLKKRRLCFQLSSQP